MPSKAPPSRRPRAWMAALAAGAAAVILYANALSGPYLYDDVVEIRDNERVHSLANVPALVSSDFWNAGQGRNPLYRPLTAIAMTATWVAGGGRPVAFHALNVALHAGASALSVLVLLGLTGSLPLAVVGGLLFAAHPVHTEAVAWISGLAELLSALFLLGAWRAHLRGRTVIAAILIGGAVLSKEGAVVFPALALAGDLLLGGTWRARVKSYAAYAGVVAGYLALRLAVLGHLIGGLSEGVPLLNPLRHVSALERALTSFAVMGRAIRQSVVPAGLCLDYGFNQIPVVSGWADASLLAGLALLAALGAMVWIGGIGSRVRRAELALGALIFLVCFLPASNLFFPAISIFAERNLYLPVLGVCLMAASLIAALARKGLAWPAWIAAGLLILPAGARTVTRNPEFRGGVDLFGAASAACPQSARAHLFHGIALREAGRTQEALAAQREAVRIAPTYSDPRAELGLDLMLLGDLTSAERELTQALHDDPNDREARGNLAWVYAETGRPQDSLREYRTAAQMFPDDPDVINNYASALIDTGSLEEARAIYQRLDAREPRSPRGPNGLGALHARKGEWDQAAASFQEALRRKPGDVDATFNLAQALVKLGRTDRALAVLDETIARGATDAGLIQLRDSLRAGNAPR